MSGHCNWVDVPELRYFWCSLLFGEPRHIKKKEEEEKEKRMCPIRGGRGRGESK